MWLRLDRLSAVLGLEHVYFRASWLLASRLLGSPVVQRRIASARVELFRRFLEATGLAEIHSVADTVRQHLLEATLVNWRYLHAAPGHRDVVLARDVVVENGHLLEQALQSGQGVLFVMSHYGAPRVFIEAMRQRGYEGRAIRAKVKKRLRDAGEEVTDLARMLRSAQDLVEAQRLLENRGVVYILPDGKYGRSGVVLPLYGRTYRVMTGFAELALSSGAAVVPVSAVPGADGTLRVTLHPPLDAGPAAMRRQERIERLAAQYAAFLSQSWASSPGSVFPNHVARFLDRAADQAASPATYSRQDCQD